MNRRHKRLRFHSHTNRVYMWLILYFSSYSYGIKQPKGEAHMDPKDLLRISGLLFEILEATNEYPEIWNIIQQLIAEFEHKFDIKFYKF